MPKDIVINGVDPNGTNRKGSVMAQNTTELLNQLLNGYDRRLRPGFGGKIVKLYHIPSHLIIYEQFFMIVWIFEWLTLMEVELGGKLASYLANMKQTF